jgi:hypothetical protein
VATIVDRTAVFQIPRPRPTVCAPPLRTASSTAIASSPSPGASVRWASLCDRERRRKSGPTLSGQRQGRTLGRREHFPGSSSAAALTVRCAPVVALVAQPAMAYLDLVAIAVPDPSSPGSNPGSTRPGAAAAATEVLLYSPFVRIARVPLVARLPSPIEPLSAAVPSAPTRIAGAEPAIFADGPTPVDIGYTADEARRNGGLR